ncbi:hypothetical protein ACLBR5_01905 [Escherichia coli]
MIIPGLVAPSTGMERAALLPRPFLSPSPLALCCGGRTAKEGELKSREGFLIVVLFWTVLGSVGAAPFIFSESPNLTYYRCVF